MKITFLDKTIEVDDECKKMGGCFNAQETLDDPETISFIKNFTKNFKDEVFLDVGANTGVMSLFAKGKVYAFEPTLNTHRVLVKNIILNDSEVTPICKAVSDEEINYHMKEFKQTGFNHIEEGGHRKTITLDSWAKENNVKNIKLIKIDTEGHDNNVVNGATQIIKRDKPIIITETMDNKIMEDLGYKIKDKVCINNIWEPKMSLSDKEIAVNIEKGRRYEPMYDRKDVKEAIKELKDKSKGFCVGHHCGDYFLEVIDEIFGDKLI